MRRAIGLAALLCLALPAHAQDRSETQPDDEAQPLAKIFVSLCVHAVPDVDRIEATAAALGLKEITALDGTAAVPAGPQTRTKAWRVAGGTGGPASLNIAQGTERGKTVTVCAVVSPSAPAEPVERAVKELLQLGRPFRTDTDAAGQASTYWDATAGGQKMIISTTDLRSDRGVNLAATVEARPGATDGGGGQFR